MINLKLTNGSNDRKDYSNWNDFKNISHRVPVLGVRQQLRVHEIVNIYSNVHQVVDNKSIEWEHNVP